MYWFFLRPYTQTPLGDTLKDERCSTHLLLLFVFITLCTRPLFASFLLFIGVFQPLVGEGVTSQRESTPTQNLFPFISSQGEITSTPKDTPTQFMHLFGIFGSYFQEAKDRQREGIVQRVRRQKEETYHPIEDDGRKIQSKERGQKKRDRGKEKKREIRLWDYDFVSDTGHTT